MTGTPIIKSRNFLPRPWLEHACEAKEYVSFPNEYVSLVFLSLLQYFEYFTLTLIYFIIYKIVKKVLVALYLNALLSGFNQMVSRCS